MITAGNRWRCPCKHPEHLLSGLDLPALSALLLLGFAGSFAFAAGLTLGSLAALLLLLLFVLLDLLGPVSVS